MSLQQFWSFVVDYGGIGLIIIVVVGGIGILIKMWPMLVKFISVGSAVADLPHTLTELSEKTKSLEQTLQVIKKEVLPNGGSSLRDAVNRTEVQLQDLARVVSSHSKQLEEGE
jgi:hypothetical protein